MARSSSQDKESRSSETRLSSRDSFRALGVEGVENVVRGHWILLDLVKVAGGGALTPKLRKAETSELKWKFYSCQGGGNRAQKRPENKPG